MPFDIEELKKIDIRITIVSIGFFSIFLLWLTIYQIFWGGKLVLPVCYLALIFGLLTEFKRIHNSLERFLLLINIAFLVSSFLMLMGNALPIEMLIKFWPFAFCIMFSITAVVLHQEDTTMRLNEGTVLVLSISMSYFTYDLFTDYHDSLYYQLLFIVCVGFAALSLYYSIHPTKISHFASLF